MEQYWIGVMTSFLLSLAWQLTLAVHFAFGIQAENFRGIGLRVSWSTGRSQPLTPWYAKNAFWIRPFKVLVAVTFIAFVALFSWFSVFTTLSTMVFWLGSMMQTPEESKKYHAGISRTSLNPQEMVTEICKFNGYDDERRVLFIENEVNPRLKALGDPELNVSVWREKIRREKQIV